MIGQETVLPLNNKANNLEKPFSLSEADVNCMREIKDVLQKHGSLGRFGVTLLHDHFPLAPDEVLVETCDESKRELTIRPVKHSEMNHSNIIETSWRLDSESEVAHCIQRCHCDERRA